MLRAAMPSDAAAFVPMRADTALQDLLMANPAGQAPADPLAEAQSWLDRRAAAGWFRIVLDAAGSNAGFVQIADIHHRNRLGWLGLALFPGQRGKGLGARALATTERAAVADLGLRKLLLQVRADNLGAIHLYERAGWRRVGCLCAQYDDGTVCHDALVYEKLLGPA